jgi:lipopolysaccharide export system protein LptA
MPFSFFSVFARGLLFLAVLCAGGRFAGVFAAEGARVGTAKKVVFSDFEKKSGVLKMELHAEEASPEKSAAADSGELSAWNLTAVKLLLYSEDAKGRAVWFATITSPDCRYSKPDHIATSSRELSMDSGDFAVTGGAWTWRRADDNDVISLQSPVRATLKSKPSLDRGRVDVFSDALDITRHKTGADAGRAILTFSGNVRMRMENPEHGDVMLFCDTLVARLKNTGDLPDAKGAAPARTKGEKGKTDDTLESIVATVDAASGKRVEIVNEAPDMSGKRVEMAGRRAEYVHAGRTFLVTDNARLRLDMNASFPELSEQKLYSPVAGRLLGTPADMNALGEKMLYHVAENTIVLSSPPVVEGGQPDLVTLEFPSFAPDEGRARQGDGIARVKGERLFINLNRKNNKKPIEMTGKVRGSDENLAFISNRFFVEIPDAAAPSALTKQDAARARYKAEGAVRADYDGQRLEGESLLFRPDTKTAELSGNPSLAASAPQGGQGVRLGGHTLSLDKTRGKVTVTSAPGRRVEVSLPPIGKVKAGETPLETLVRADSLVMTEKDNNKAELNFSGNVVIQGNIEGNCDCLDIVADIPRKRGASSGARLKPVEMAAHIDEMTATGHVSLAEVRVKGGQSTTEWRAEGGQAVVYPKVALRENSPRDDNGLDGKEPHALVLRPHLSTPGKRPRLTLFAPEIRDRLAAPSPASAGKHPAPRRLVPYHIEGDSLEIIGGSMRMRFFMRGNIRLSDDSGAVGGGCNEIEGELVNEEVPRAAPARTGAGALPRYKFTRIIGRGNVHVATRRKKSGDIHGAVQENKVFGQRFEFFPEAQQVRVTGDPSMKDNDGMNASPGPLGAILYNGRTGEWEMEKGAAADGDEEYVPRPSVSLPVKGDWKNLLP